MKDCIMKGGCNAVPFFAQDIIYGSLITVLNRLFKMILKEKDRWQTLKGRKAGRLR